MPRRLVPVLLLLAVLPGCLQVRNGWQVLTSSRSKLERPGSEPFREALLERLQVAPGWKVEVFATGVENARILALAPDGAVLVSQPKKGTVLALRDRDGDGRAEDVTPLLTDLPGVHGLHVHAGQLLLATVEQVHVAPLQPDGTLGARRVLVERLPRDGGQHPNRTLAVGPDGRLYVSVGSTCNACREDDPESATLLRFALDGSGRETFARGLRNTIGFGWHPDTRELWGMDHGNDHRGNDLPPEELNHLQQGKDYGWPDAFGQRQVDPLTDAPEDGPSKEARAAASEPMVLGYQAHSAPMQLVFHDGTGGGPRGDAFVAMRGSWNREPAVGYELVRVRFEGGRPVAFEPFVKGFLLQSGKQFARPVGLVQLPDGSLVMGDDTGGTLLRVRPTGG